MYKLCNTKYFRIDLDLQCWGIFIDWCYSTVFRPVIIHILCFDIEIGKDPLRGYKYEED